MFGVSHVHIVQNILLKILIAVGSNIVPALIVCCMMVLGAYSKPKSGTKRNSKKRKRYFQEEQGKRHTPLMAVVAQYTRKTDCCLAQQSVLAKAYNIDTVANGCIGFATFGTENETSTKRSINWDLMMYQR